MVYHDLSTLPQKCVEIACVTAFLFEKCAQHPWTVWSLFRFQDGGDAEEGEETR